MPIDNRILKDGNWKGFSSATHGFVATIGKDTINPYFFQFNPNKLSGGTNAKYEMQSLSASTLPIASFLHMDNKPFMFRLFVDASDAGSYNMARREINGEKVGVWADIVTLVGMMNPDYSDSLYVKVQNINRFNAPTNILFGWGPIITKAVLTTVSWDIQFWSESIPIRAEIDITLNPISSGLENDYNLMKNLQNSTKDALPISLKNTQDLISSSNFKIYGSAKYFGLNGETST